MKSQLSNSFKYQRQPFMIKSQAVATKNNDSHRFSKRVQPKKIIYSAQPFIFSLKSRIMHQNPQIFNRNLIVKENYNKNALSDNQKQTSLSNNFYKQEYQINVNHKPIIERQQQKKRYLTNQDINIRQISIKIQKILSRLQEQQKKPVYNNSSTDKTREFSGLSKAFNSAVSKLSNRQNLDYLGQCNSYSSQKSHSVKDYNSISERNSYFRSPIVKPIENDQRNVYSSQILSKFAINKDQMQKQVLSLKAQRNYLHRQYCDNKCQNLSQKYNRIKQRSQTHEKFRQNRSQIDKNNRKLDEFSRAALSKQFDQFHSQLNGSIIKSQFPKNYPRNYNEVKLRYKTQPNQELNFGQLRHKRMTTEPDSLNKNKKYDNDIFNEPKNSEKLEKFEKKSIQEIRSKYKYKAQSPMKTVQNAIVQIPKLKLKSGKDINQAINEIQIKIDRCNNIKENIFQRKQQQTKKLQFKQNNAVRTTKKQVNQLYGSALEQTGNFKQTDYKNPSKTKLNCFTFNKEDKQNRNMQSYQKQMYKKLDYCQSIETSKLINALATQIKLDSEFRKAKNWICSWENNKKWELLHQNFKRRGLVFFTESDLRTVFEVRQQQNDPFYSFRDDHQSIQSITNKYLICQQHWIRNIYQKFNYQSLLREGFISKVESATANDRDNPQFNSHSTKANIVFSVSSLIRLLNFQYGQFYRIRDVFLIYGRFSKGMPLTLRQFLGEISKNQQY